MSSLSFVSLIINLKNNIQLLLLHFNICGPVRRGIRKTIHSIWWFFELRHPSSKRKWWIWSSLNAISCANKSQSKVHRSNHSSYLCAQFVAFSNKCHTHTLSLFLLNKIHACVCRLTSRHKHTQCMRIKEKSFIFLSPTTFLLLLLLLPLPMPLCSQNTHCWCVWVLVFFSLAQT